MRTRTLMLAALAAGVAMSALAQPYQGRDRPPPGRWDRIGSVDFQYWPTRETQYGNFGGSVERLSFRSPEVGVYCRNVTATFVNGQTRQIFRGTIEREGVTVVDLPGESRLLRRIDFDCFTLSRRGGRVDIFADVGRYRPEWRQSRDWDRVWSRTFIWDDDRRGNDNRDDNRWVTLGTERFDGPRDRETTIAGARGRSIDTIGLKPLDADARCSRITATFRDGRRSDLTINRGDLLLEDRMYTVDLPGGDRNVDRLDINCRAERGGDVTIQVYGNT